MTCNRMLIASVLTLLLLAVLHLVGAPDRCRLAGRRPGLGDLHPYSVSRRGWQVYRMHRRGDAGRLAPAGESINRGTDEHERVGSHKHRTTTIRMEAPELHGLRVYRSVSCHRLVELIVLNLGLRAKVINVQIL